MAWTVLRRSLVAALLVASSMPADAKQRVVRLTIGPFPIEAKRDREVCQAVRLTGVRGMDVLSYEVRSRTGRDYGTHHFVAYGYQGAASRSFPTAMVDDPGCNGFGPTDFFTNRVQLAGSGGEHRRGRWLETVGGTAPGLAQRLPNPHDAPDDAVIILNSHYFNTGTRRVRGLVKLKLRLATADPGKRTVRTVTDLAASRGIFVPPGQRGVVSATWQADGAPNYTTEGGQNPAGDVCVLYVSGHMHKRGTLFTIDYEEDGKPPERLLAATDYVHPGVVYYGGGFLLKAYTAENGHPRYHYSCTHENGSAYEAVKLGCESTPGEVPGMSWEQADALGISSLESHARPCGVDGVNCQGYGTGRCVEANLVFGPLSDDDMCVLPAAIYDPLPGLPPDQACNPFRRS